MKHFDYESLLNKRRKGYKTFLIIFFVLLTIYIALFTFGVIYSTYETRKMIMIIFSIVLSLLALGLIYSLFFGVIQNKKEIKVLMEILNAYLFDISGEILSISSQSITIKNRKVIEITLLSNEQTYVTYFDLEFIDNPFKVGEHVNLRTSNSFIVYYEETK